MMFYFMSETVDVKGIPQVAIGVALVAWSSIRTGIAWDFFRVLGALSLLVSASLVMIGFMVVAASTAIWIVNSFALLMLTSSLKDYACYPLTIFNGAFRIIFSVIVPIGFVAFYPVKWILHSGESGIIPFLTPIVGISCFILGYVVWAKGTRRWSGTGT